MPAKHSDRIFLCHASEDGPAIEQIYQTLRAARLNPWLDKRDLPPARDWDAEIRKTLDAACLVLVFVSPHLISKRGYVQREIEMALDTFGQMSPGSTFVVPVRLDECPIPASLAGLTPFDLFTETDVDNLVEHLKTVIGLFTDPRDGQIYKTIPVGNHIWLAENLNHAVVDSWWYDDDPLNGRRYGRLYTWEAAQRACPSGWHVPSDSEWKDLALTFGGYRDMDEGYVNVGVKIGKPLAAYESLIKGGKSGFDACLGGYRNSAAQFSDLNKIGLYWSSSDHQYSDLGNFHPVYNRDIKTAWIYYFYLLAGMPEVRRHYQVPLLLGADEYPRRCGLAVRCVKDAPRTEA